MNYPVPSVVRKHGNRTAIVLAKGRKLFQVVELESKKLLVRGRSCEELQRLGYEPTTWSPIDAARKYLEHSAGLSPNARQALEQLIEDAWML
jgi:hypothetical protein